MHIKIRCPLCGMLAYLRNLGKQHKLQMFRVEIGGSLPKEAKGDKVKGKVAWTEIEPTGANTIEEIWLSYLLDTAIEMVKKTVESKKLDTIIQKKIMSLSWLIKKDKDIDFDAEIPIKIKDVTVPFRPIPHWQVIDTTVQTKPIIPINITDVYVPIKALPFVPTKDIMVHIKKIEVI